MNGFPDLFKVAEVGHLSAQVIGVFPRNGILPVPEVHFAEVYARENDGDNHIKVVV